MFAYMEEECCLNCLNSSASGALDLQILNAEMNANDDKVILTKRMNMLYSFLAGKKYKRL